MSGLPWRWHRLRAMTPGEVALRLRKKFRELTDARRRSWRHVDLTTRGRFPVLPRPDAAPDVVRAALRRDADDILAGRWLFFGHLNARVDDPPKWQRDYLAGKDVETGASAFALDHREPPGGADSKVIWEPSRWHQLARLAMAAYVLGDGRAAERCVAWLEDWTRRNRPYRGWNWTSPLEAGIRLIQFAWIESLLDGYIDRLTIEERGGVRRDAGGSAAGPAAASAEGGRELARRLSALAGAVLPPHFWYVWRHRSFGSSANNHLLGELAGLVVALVRWPGLARLGPSLDMAATAWRAEVFSQFADDGGCREQALNYQLFSWELCWQAFSALATTGRPANPTEQRLAFAGRFYWDMQSPTDPWDYGDSDNGFVVPVFAGWKSVAAEWHQWLEAPERSPAVNYWLNDPPAALPPTRLCQPLTATAVGDWWYYSVSGMAVAEAGSWRLRWDLSPLGYLKTAAHGHLDALHLSIWVKGVAVVIDPGTGAYYADRRLRDWLASREAHNGPCPEGVAVSRRLGPFLWGDHHETPRLTRQGEVSAGSLAVNGGTLHRSVRRAPQAEGWEVADSFERSDGRGGAFSVRWQFAPGSWVKRHSDRKLSVHRADVAVMIEVDESWNEVVLHEPVGAGGTAEPGDLAVGKVGILSAHELPEGVVSPGFRRICRAPYLLLRAAPRGDKPCVFSTTFLASAHS